MNEKKKIYSKRFPKLTAEELDKEFERLNFDFHDTPNNARKFIELMKRDTTYRLNKKRFENKDEFIDKVIELSESYEIDTDLYQENSFYNADLYMHCCSYSGYIKKLITVLFMLSDEFSIFISSQENDYDFILSLTYHTHDVFIRERKITELD